MANSVKLALRNDFVKKNGCSPVELKLSINLKVRRIKTGIGVPKEYWDFQNATIKKDFSEEKPGATNLLLKSKLKRAEDIIYQYELHNKVLTVDLFLSEYNHVRTNSFYDFVTNELTSEINKSKNRAVTLKGFGWELDKIKRFRAKLDFNEITVSFLSAYEVYMRNKLNNKTNTIHKSMRFIRNFINRAIQQDFLKDNVFNKYSLKTEKTERSFLSIDELKQLETYVRHNAFSIKANNQKNILIFIFCCRTGLRYSDVKALRYKHIINNKIILTMHKTNDRVVIPLDDRLKELIGTGTPEQLVFNVPCNQVLNRSIKLTLAKVGITKQLTFHCSRHTFATIGISLGIPIDIVSKLCGHRDLKTTMIYTHYTDELKIQEYAKWGGV